MATFNGKTITKLAVQDLRTDRTLPKSRSLAFKSITQDTAMSGTKGQHCNLVHGDRWHEVRGNETSTVRINQNNLVQGNHKETIVGRCYQNIIGPHITQNNNVRNETYLAKQTQVWGTNEKVNDDSGQQAIKPSDAEFVYVEAISIHTLDLSVVGAGTTVYGLSVYAALLDFALVLAHIEAVLSSTEVHSSHTEMHMTDISAALVHAEGVLSSNEFHAAHTEFHLAHLEAHNMPIPAYTPGG